MNSPINYPNIHEHLLVGWPSGESFYMNGLQLYNLYENDLIEYDPFNEFWRFDDKNVEKVKMRIK